MQAIYLLTLRIGMQQCLDGGPLVLNLCASHYSCRDALHDMVLWTASLCDKCWARALDGGKAKATEAVAPDELIEVDEQQLKYDAQMVAEVEVVVHANNVPASIRILHFASA